MQAAFTAVRALTKWHDDWGGEAESHDHVEYDENPGILNSIPEVILTSLR